MINKRQTFNFKFPAKPDSSRTRNPGPHRGQSEAVAAGRRAAQGEAAECSERTRREH